MSIRSGLIAEITSRTLTQTIPAESHGEALAISYGENSFNDVAMKEFLPYKAYKELRNLIKKGGQKINSDLAEEVAHGMKEWALTKGATHFTHWFQPMTGLTAEKHDSFLDFDSKGESITRFSGKNLSQGEPDASSFPSGGIRATFEARGYTAWDPTSPAFIIEGVNGATLCIPTVFLSYTGEALDKKTPLLRSMEKLNDVALKVLKLFGNENVTHIFSTVGPEQEYFLVDKAYYNARPDLVITGRTLFGASSPKDQQMDDHYFGSIRERVLAFMQDAEDELFKLGIPVKTRHNEVAPAQFELAPIFEDSNVATDHNQVVMDVLKKIAARHEFALLLHEKPFGGVNGSGKHNNWSMSDSEGNNLLEPGKTPHENLQFLTFLSATIKAVYKYADVLRANIASAGNDHRLGANEAPPAIISIFLGQQLSTILNDLISNKKSSYSDKEIIELGISKLPVISKDNTDRNRTSPFAFTGNKFEFRAVGSAQSIAPPNITINTIVASVLDEMYDKIKSNLDSGKSLNDSVLSVIAETVKESQSILFEGNNYSSDWEKEAEKRGLPNKKTTPEALQALILPKNKEVFIKYGVLNEREIESRYNVELEKYSQLIDIEARTAITMANTIIYPAVIGYQTDLANAVSTLASVGESKAVKPQKEFLSQYASLVVEMKEKTSKLENILAKTANTDDEEKKAKAYSQEVLSAMNNLRETVDTLEELTDDALWPLPKYREMLFVY